MKVFKFTFSNGDTYELPIEIVAKDMATYYAKKEYIEEAEEKGKFINKNDIPKDKLWEEIFEREYSYVIDDIEELQDWLTNNMNWKDVQNQAVFIKREVINEEEEWPNLEITIQEI